MQVAINRVSLFAATIDQEIGVGSGSGDGDEESEDEDLVPKLTTNRPVSTVSNNEDIMLNASWNAVNAIPKVVKDSSSVLQSTAILLIMPIFSILVAGHLTSKL